MWDLSPWMLLDLCTEVWLEWNQTPGSRYSRAAQREAIMAQVEPVPSVLVPGSAPYRQAMEQLGLRMRRTKDPDRRAMLQEQLYSMGLKHNAALKRGTEEWQTAR